MEIDLVAFEDGVVAIGFRRLSSYVRTFYPDLRTTFYNIEGKKAFIRNRFRKESEREIPLNPAFCAEVAKSDAVGVSCMSKYAEVTSRFIREIKRLNPRCYVVWGGVHAIMEPEGCIQVADAVCTGEGEEGFVEVLRELERGGRPRSISGFWFRNDGVIERNPPRKLMTADRLGSMPFQDYSEGVRCADHSGTREIDPRTYLEVQGTKYTTMWAIGCPFRCSYCGNTRFLEMDPSYGRVRYPPVAFIIEEIERVLRSFPFISFIEFQDDNFFLIKEDDLFEFASAYRQRIALPFFIPGIYPGHIRNERVLDSLIGAGLRKVRMGIQSGSPAILSFFNRRTSVEQIEATANLLISRYPRISAPFFDIIIDVPTQNEEDFQQTLALLRRLKRPFFLYVYSLRLIPNTDMARFAHNHPDVPFIPIESNYNFVLNKRHGALVYLLALGRSPRWMERAVDRLMRSERMGPALFVSIKLIYYGKRFMNELSNLNLNPIAAVFPKLLWILYCSGLMKWMTRRFQDQVRKVPWDPARTATPPPPGPGKE
jgi:anaerobic magnesium-protoporphyrin IX monomethyl ester cyclase